MLDLSFTGDTQEVEPGLKLLQNEHPFCGYDGSYSIEVHKSEDEGLSITVSEGKSIIGYHEKSDFFRALPLFALHLNEKGYKIKETPCFNKTGVMLDCSRNAVPTVDTLKGILRKMALMGMNVAMLYTEDTYEIKALPYFGYMRGRYTYDEIKGLDDYADTLGVELVPCIQTLAHLERALQWPEFEDLRDGERNLLVGDEKTYAFIEEMIKAACAPYRSNRIHIGMDEAWELGLGRYLSKYGYRPCGELMVEHLKHVSEILKKYDLHAMMWSDMHFIAASPSRALYDAECKLTAEVLAGAPEEIDLVYWDYYNESESHYNKLLNLHGQFSSKTVFAGGIWTWIGPATDYRKTLAASLPALKQCKEHAIKEVIATAWGDDGAEANIQTILYGMQLFAEYRYTGEYNEEEVSARFFACCGTDSRPFLDFSMFNDVPGLKLMDQSTATPGKTLLFEDPLIPLFEEDFRGLPCEEHYSELAERYSNYADTHPNYRQLFDFYAKLAASITQKCIWRNHAADCVRSGDHKGAADMINLAENCIESLQELKNVWVNLWYTTNKPYGFEVIDLRLSGLIGRFETSKIRFAQFMRGEIDTIEELAAPKLPYLRDETGAFRCMNSWGSIATVCRIVG